MSIDLFDVGYYRIANPDLALAGLTSNAQLLSHFQAYGLNEGRSFSPMVDMSFYRYSNPDLATAGLTTNKQLLDHLQNYGVAEGRHFSPFVDLNFYLQDYSDLAGAFKGNREQALQHLETFGLKEGRQFSPDLDLNFYLTNNPDVNKAVSGSQLGALEHLEKYGLQEGRLFSPFVDLNLYRAFNPDLKSFDNSQSLQHLERYGIGEGRQFSHAFNTDYYASSNPDLLTFYAAGKKMRTDAVAASTQEFSSFRNFAYNHFIINGINEGRRSSDEFDVNFYKAENSDLAKFNNIQLYQHFRSYGLNEARKLSDAYDAKFYSTNNSAPAGLNQKQLYEYYISPGGGKSQEDFATENLIFPDEELRSLDLTSGKTTLQATLSSNSPSNPTRLGSYSEDFGLSGLDVGQQVQIDLTAKYDTILQLIDAQTGEIITQNDNISPSNLNSHINFTAQPNTEYVVRATSVDASALGDFTLTASAASTVVGSIKVDNSISENLSNTDLPDPVEPEHFRRDYSLDLTGVIPEELVKVDMNSSTFNTNLQLVNADTKEVIAQSDSGGNQTPNTYNSELFFRVTRGINYIIRASSFTAGATGSFTLTTALEGASIKPNQAVNSMLKDNNFDAYNLDTTGVNPGDQIRLNLNSSKFDTFLEVIGSDGSTVNNDNANGTTNSELTIVQKANTFYTIKVSRAAKDTLGSGSYTLTTTPLTDADSNFTLSDSGMQSVLGNKMTLSRKDVLDFFTQAGIDGTVTTAEQADLKKLADNAVRFEMADSVKFLLTKVNEALRQTTNATADATASVLQVAKDRWFLGTQAPKPEFTDTLHKKKYLLTNNSIKGNLYGTDSEAKIRGINQNGEVGFGDCSFLSALGATFAKPKDEKTYEGTSSSIINQMIEKNSDGTFTFRFFNRGMASYVTVNSEVPTVELKGTSPLTYGLAFGRRGGLNSTTNLNDDKSSIWGSITVRAYAQFREGLEKDGKGYDLIGNGDYANRTLAFVTGRQVDYYTSNNGGPFLNSNDKTPKAATFVDIMKALDNNRAVEAGTVEKVSRFDEKELESGLFVGSHAYAVTNAYVDKDTKQQHIVVRNPWGEDGGTRVSGDPNDGFIDLSYEQFTREFDELAFA